MGEAARPILLRFCLERRLCDARLPQLVRPVPVPDADIEHLVFNAAAFERILGAKSDTRAWSRVLARRATIAPVTTPVTTAGRSCSCMD